MVSQVVLRLEAHHVPVVHGYFHFDEVGVEQNVILHGGEVDGQGAVRFTIIMLGQVGKAVLFQKCFGPLDGFFLGDGRFGDRPGGQHGDDLTAGFGHPNGTAPLLPLQAEHPSGQVARNRLHGLQGLGADAYELGCVLTGAGTGDLLQAFQAGFGFGLEAVGEGAIVNQSGQFRKIRFHGLETALAGLGAQALCALGAVQALFHGGQVLQGSLAVIDLLFQLVQGLGQLAGGFGEGFHRLQLVAGIAPLGGSGACQRLGVVPHFGDEGRRLGQLHIGVGQLANGLLSGLGLAIDFRPQGGDLGGRGGTGLLFQAGAHALDAGGQLGEGVGVVVGGEPLVLDELGILLHDGARQQDESGGEIGCRSNAGATGQGLEHRHPFLSSKLKNDMVFLPLACIKPCRFMFGKSFVFSTLCR